MDLYQNHLRHPQCVVRAAGGENPRKLYIKLITMSRVRTAIANLYIIVYIMSKIANPISRNTVNANLCVIFGFCYIWLNYISRASG
jgi:hypothetical protein